MDWENFGWDDLGKHINGLSQHEALRTLQYLFEHGYECKDDDLYSLLKIAVEYGKKQSLKDNEGNVY